MPRPRTKEELVLASKENYEKLNHFISKLSEEELQTPFDFSWGNECRFLEEAPENILRRSDQTPQSIA